MKRKLTQHVPRVLMAALLLGTSLVSHAQSEYPNKPIRLIIGFPAGGSTDIVGRIVAQKLSERLGQSIVVENRGGAGGTIGTDAAAKAAPDGYTLTLGTTSTMAVAPGAYSKLGYDPIKSFSPISLVAVTPYLLVVNPQVPAKSLAELVALVKSQPGKLNYASAGNGSTTQLATEMLNDVTGMKMTHIPYKGNAAADLAILSNQVEVLFGSMPALLQHAKTNKLRALAVGSSTRSSALPETPTVAELGYPGFEAALWLGVLAPAGTPKPIIDKLNKELVAIAATADFKAAMDKNGADATSNTPEQFASLIKNEVGKYGSITKRLGIKLD
ncbi:tripartite tricarboxylate transporter substrate binding protein [Alcaligenaceae bacterium LF4-65]|jgi:tripartite-type tricarboxylate transporter receptor subunit TctC|uniref:Tripartite tricarboxylate transporter substrate binding protein n=1 Tax=Zwartia hollandica TaxID=324606 RepID=A0A953N975_9BURK|nr:tripartite tricarboxylate transporter substrate binding protein [Zwartia hollandica]MBZ1350308.1 tripartite tricarboxylate transporter substrate binding protein [Zwartia hollandica]